MFVLGGWNHQGKSKLLKWYCHESPRVVFLMVIKSAACFAMPSDWSGLMHWINMTVWHLSKNGVTFNLATLSTELSRAWSTFYIVISCPMYTREFQTPVFSSSWDAGFSMLAICSHSCWLESQSMLSIGVYGKFERKCFQYIWPETPVVCFFSGKQIHWSSILQRSYRLQDAAEETEDTKDSSEMVTEAPSDEEMVTEAPSDEELVTEAPSGENEAGIQLPFGIWTCS